MRIPVGNSQVDVECHHLWAVYLSCYVNVQLFKSHNRTVQFNSFCERMVCRKHTDLFLYFLISETVVTFKETQISASMVKTVLRYVWCGDMVMIYGIVS